MSPLTSLFKYQMSYRIYVFAGVAGYALIRWQDPTHTTVRLARISRYRSTVQITPPSTLLLEILSPGTGEKITEMLAHVCSDDVIQ